ncbi:MAG: nucleoside monophosphate kinase [bacterium]
MKSLCVCIYGETCAGKSTLGKYLKSSMDCQYISFGDSKRQEIALGTTIGLEIQRLLKSRCPLPAELGYSVIKNVIGNYLNIVSGYPISIDELNTLANHSKIIGILLLSIDEQTLIRRFSLRRECPKCQMPGVIGDSCPVHKVSMIQREDVSLKELIFRRKLYQQRIAPFLTSKVIETLPRLSLDTGVLTKEDVVCRAEKWIRETLRNQEGESI